MKKQTTIPFDESIIACEVDLSLPFPDILERIKPIYMTALDIVKSAFTECEVPFEEIENGIVLKRDDIKKYESVFETDKMKNIWHTWKDHLKHTGAYYPMINEMTWTIKLNLNQKIFSDEKEM